MRRPVRYYYYYHYRIAAAAAAAADRLSHHTQSHTFTLSHTWIYSIYHLTRTHTLWLPAHTYYIIIL